MAERGRSSSGLGVSIDTALVMPLCPVLGLVLLSAKPGGAEPGPIGRMCPKGGMGDGCRSPRAGSSCPTMAV